MKKFAMLACIAIAAVCLGTGSAQAAELAGNTSQPECIGCWE